MRHQRAEYLQQQLALEKMASEVVFHTVSITNALSPDEYFEQISRPTVENIFTEDPFGKLFFFSFFNDMNNWQLYWIILSCTDQNRADMPLGK